MPDLPSPGGTPVPFFTDAELIESIKSVFSHKLRADNALDRGEWYHHFLNLAGICMAQERPALIREFDVDYTAAQAMFARFQRDAFGVKYCHEYLETLVHDGEIDEVLEGRLHSQLEALGIRINTESPRRTKIAAVFSLWMSVFRPIRLKGLAYEGLTREDQVCFCATINFWMACMYLSLVGQVIIKTDDDGQTRSARIRHDLTYRALNLSSLEMLYMSVYKPREGEPTG